MAVEKQVYGTNTGCSSVYTVAEPCMHRTVSKANRIGFNELSTLKVCVAFLGCYCLLMLMQGFKPILPESKRIHLKMCN